MPCQKWYSLYDKVFAIRTLWEAWEKVRANGGAPGVDGQSIEAFAAHAEENLARLHEELRTKRYRPQPVRRCWIPKASGGKRPLGVPCVRDRVVQQALRLVLEPIFEEKFLPNSHGFRPGKGAHTSISWVRRALRQGRVWVVDADIKGYFDTIPHEKVLEAVNEEIADGSVLRLLRMFLGSGVWEEGEVYETEEGTPQGGVISPLLANIYLHVLDKVFWEELPGVVYVRYADDFLVLCRSRAAAKRALEKVRAVVEGQLGLTLHPEKTRICHLRDGFDFLGYHFELEPWQEEKGYSFTIRPRDRKVEALKAEIRRLTRRNQGLSLKEVIRRTTRYLLGWGSYFRWSNYRQLFRTLTAWIRRRLRAYQIGRWGMAWSNRQYPNSYLEALGFVVLREGKWYEARPVPIWARPSWKAGCERSARPV